MLIVAICACAAVAHSQRADDEAIYHFQVAHQAQDAGNFGVAEQEYLKVIHLKPDTAEVYASLGLVYNADKKFKESALSLEHAEKLKPRLPGVSLYLGIDYIKLNQSARAIPLLKRAIVLEPANKDAQRWLGIALWDAGDIPALLEQMYKASETFPTAPDILFALGEAYRRAADQAISHVVQEASGTPLVHQIYGDIYRDEQVWVKAIGHYQRAIEQDPRWQGAHLGLGEVNLRQEKFDAAELEFHRELQMNPSSVAAQAGLAEIALLQNRTEDALALLTTAIHISPDQTSLALDLPPSYPAVNQEFSEPIRANLQTSLLGLESSPDSPAKYLAIAFVNAQLNDKSAFETAWKNFQRVTQYPPGGDLLQRARHDLAQQHLHAAEVDLEAWQMQHPKDLKAQYLMGRTYHGLSLLVLEKLLTVAPDSYQAHQLLAQTYENNEEDLKAIGEYKAAEQLAPDLPDLHFAIGHLLWKTGNMDGGLAELKNALRLNPDCAEANAEVGSILLTQDKQAEAITYLEKAILLEPDLWTAHRELGKAYYQQKEFEKAEAELKTACVHDSEGASHYQLGMVYRALGQSESANAEFALSRKIKNDHILGEEGNNTLKALNQ